MTTAADGESGKEWAVAKLRAHVRTYVREQGIELQPVADVRARRKEIEDDRIAVARSMDMIGYQLACLDQVLTFLVGLNRYEFLRESLDGHRIASSSETLKLHIRKLGKSLDDMKSADHGLEEALGDEQWDHLERGSAAIRDAQEKADVLFREVEQASKDMLKVSNEIPDIVDAAAVRAYFDNHPTQSMENLRSFKQAAESVLGVAGVFAPPLHQWVVGLLQVITDIGVRLMDEGLKTDAATLHAKTHTRGEIFDEYTNDPFLMAKALNRSVKSNVSTALKAVGLIAGEIKVWPLLVKGIEASVDAWLDQRIELAKAAMETRREESGAEGWKEVLGEMRESFEAEILDELKDPENWAEVAKQRLEEEWNEDWLVGLSGTLFAPLAKQLVKLLPVVPADIVTGRNLAGMVEGSIIAKAIPPGYGTKPVPTTDDNVARHTSPISSLVGTYRGTVIDSNSAQDEVGSDGHKKVYVAFACYGAKVWGFLTGPQSDGSATWHPKLIDRTEGNAAWQKRQVTTAGWREDGQPEVSGGTWYIPAVESMSEHYYLYVHAGGTRSEWLRGPIGTKFGTADAVFAPLRGSMPRIDLRPDDE